MTTPFPGESPEYRAARDELLRQEVELRPWDQRSGEVEAIEVHDLVPRSHEVTHELLLRVVACVDLRDGSELGVRTEDEVDGGGGPLGLARREIATLVQVLRRRGCLPLRAH